MTADQRKRRAKAMRAWRRFNPIARRLAGIAPWWVLLETTGRRSGRPRRTPLANGPFDSESALLICVHGEHATFARNIAADPRVRLKRRGRWHEGTAELLPLDPASLARFSRYARLGARAVGIEPRLIRIRL
jgi:deazaflavin-dependent oxidoreductase (nitroreductase family)